MKKQIIAFLAALVLLLLCTGCALFETEYTYAEPYVETLDRDAGDAVEIRNYSMLKAAILDMINSRETSGELRFSNYNGTVSDDLAAVCLEIKSANPMGAYAVDTLTYDSSRIVSYYMAEINITYQKTLEEIRSVRNIASDAELEEYLRDTLACAQPKAAVRAYWTVIDEAHVAALLERICFSDPVNIPIPVAAEIRGYPNEGSNRIFEISLDYRAVPMQRTRMSAAVRNAVADILSEPLPDAPAVKAGEIAQRLSGGLTAEAGKYGGTAYGALVEHGADSLGVALAYGVLCREAGIECVVVRGGIGTMGTEEHYWNIIGIDGAYYHADVSRFAADPQHTFLMNDDAFWGNYIWDTEAYPACGGPLHYADALLYAEAAENETPSQEENPEETPAAPETEPLPEEGEAPQPAGETSKIKP